MSDLSDEFADHIETLEAEFGSLSSKSSLKFRDLETWLEETLELPQGSVTAKYIGSSGNLGNRIGEMPRRNPAAKLGCVLVPHSLIEAASALAEQFLSAKRGAF